MKYTVLLLLLVSTSFVFSQDDTTSNWDVSGIITITGSQVKLSNWSAGGDQQIGANGMFNMTANYKNGLHNWNNNLVLGYGTQRLIDKSKEFQKTDDKFEFSSKYGYSTTTHFYFSGILDFKSQLDKGYKTLEDLSVVRTSLPWSPAYILYTIGVDYKPTDNFAIYTSVLTGKTTLVLDTVLSNQGAFGVEKGATSRSEFGSYIKIEYTTEIIKNVTIKTKLDLFSNYKYFLSQTDVNWDLLIAMKINKYLSANITSQIIYDQDVVINGHKSLVQFKNVTGVGLSFKF